MASCTTLSPPESNADEGKGATAALCTASGKEPEKLITASKHQPPQAPERSLKLLAMLELDSGLVQFGACLQTRDLEDWIRQVVAFQISRHQLQEQA